MYPEFDSRPEPSREELIALVAAQAAEIGQEASPHVFTSERGGPMLRLSEVCELQWFRANKRELLMVLDRPKIPLHTNGSENDIRCQVTKRR